MKSRAAIAQYEATIVLVMISLSLASVVYSGLRRESRLDPQPIFVSEETAIGGVPAIEEVEVNSSADVTISSLSLDTASSAAGILAFDGSAYSTKQSLCVAGATTFFSVLASQAGTLRVATNGLAWISGNWRDSVNVTAGWREVMIESGTSCTVTLPGGESVPAQWNASSSIVSSTPVEGALKGTAFTVYVPTGGASHGLLITTSGGFDRVSI